MIDRSRFFDEARPIFSGDRLGQGQVDGMTFILDEWERHPEMSDLRWLAYMFGTTFHETAQTMRPIEEYGRGRGRPYGIPDKRTGQTYYGRGYVQLTWYDNYDVMGRVIGVDLLNHPEKALDPNIAAEVMFEGMTNGKTGVGDFTRKSLDQYFNSKTEDWVNARRVINGLDKAQTIADYSKRFYRALQDW